jgi:hypothetical protein
LFLNNIFFKTHGSFKKYVLVPKISKKRSNHCIFSDNIKHILPGRDFHFYVKEIDGWKARSHATQLEQFFPSDTFEIYKGPSD